MLEPPDVCAVAHARRILALIIPEVAFIIQEVV